MGRIFLMAVAIALSNAPDPWTKVPPLPTGCYSGQDPFGADILAAIEAMSAEIKQQDGINSGLSEALAKIDGAERARRLQSFMMSNPQDAMKILQASQATGGEGSETGVAREGKRQKLDQEEKELEARYKAELDTARAPIAAKLEELDKRAQKALVPWGESWVYAPWAKTEFDSLNAQVNKGYEKVCAGWWPASGTFPEWLKRYREFLQAGIPLQEKLDDVGKAQYEMMGMATSSFRSTAGMKAVRDYMRQASGVFAQRRVQPELAYDARLHH